MNQKLIRTKILINIKLYFIIKKHWINLDKNPKILPLEEFFIRTSA